MLEVGAMTSDAKAGTMTDSEIADGIAVDPPQTQFAAPGPEAPALIAMLRGMVEPLGRSLPSSSEVVLHDLLLLPNSIIAVHGDVTGRRVGDPATDLLLEQVASGAQQDNIVGYRTRLPDGRELRSSTMIMRDFSGTPIAALCVNTDVSTWLSVQRLAESMVYGVSSETVPGLDLPAVVPAEPTATKEAPRSETFVRDIDELAALLLNQAVDDVGVPVSLMKKEHKVEVVRVLKKRGMFLIREGVEMVANALDVTRFTIYNYLNEIDGESGDSDG